ncbi:MAG: peptidoglycan-binding domain-containing protein [Candidatus Paceibacterota bacterium]
MIRLLGATLLLFIASVHAGAVEADFQFRPAEFDLRIAPQEVVEDAQEALYRLDLLPTVDGVYGPATERAIAKFQRGIEREETGRLTRLQFDSLVSLLPKERWGAVSISPSSGVSSEAHGRGDPGLAEEMALRRCERYSLAADCVTFMVDQNNWLVVLRCVWDEPYIIAMKAPDMIVAEKAAVHQASIHNTTNQCQVEAVIHATWGPEVD